MHAHVFLYVRDVDRFFASPIAIALWQLFDRRWRISPTVRGVRVGQRIVLLLEIV